MSAVPPSFTPLTSFSTLAQQPISSTGLPGSELDGEFSRASDSINQIRDRLSEVQRDDGKLRNGVVNTESLSDDVIGMFIASGARPITWAIGISIAVGDLVSNPPGTSGTFLAIAAHTSSSVFSTDLANWALIAAPPTVGMLYTNTFTGNGTTTAFTLTQTPASKDNTQVFIDGVYQPKSGYSLSGAILTISPAPAAGSDIEVSIGVPSTSNIVTVVDGAITTAKLADNSVTTAKIVNGSITSAKVGTLAIGNLNIQPSAITSDKISDSAVTTAKIAQLSINSDKIIDDSIITSKYAALSVVADKIAANAITTAKIADNAITSAKISDLSVSSSKIVDAAIDTTKIADNAVTSLKIPTSAITSSKIAAGAVTTDKLAQLLTLATAQNSTSGTSVDFTGIPSWAKTITVMFSGVSTNSTDDMIVQLGDGGGLEITGYLSYATDFGGIQAFTNGFGLTRSYSAASLNTGTLVLTKISGNTWVANGNIGNATAVSSSVGTKTLSDTITQIRISTEGGAGVFDAGSINIMYE